MGLTIEMHDPVGTILEELKDSRITQASVAITYAFVIAQMGNATDYAAINSAIRGRWKGKTTLVRVKEAAWKHVEYWNDQVKIQTGARP